MQTKQLLDIHDRLAAIYGEPELTPDHDPLGGLVETILSQSTSDINSHRAFGDLRQAFPSWEAVRDAPAEDVARAIQRGGLANIKAQRIQAALRALTGVLPQAEGDETFDARFARWLTSMPVTQAQEQLQKLPGVGPKTAACVLLFSLGLPAMPVDTHVFRVSQRLGLIPSGTSLNRAHAAFDAATPAEMVYPLHILLITHGRKVCRAQNPRCDGCALLEICPFGQRRVYGDASENFNG
jgi:endonuclease III